MAINPFTPKSDRHVTSSDNINTLVSKQVIRIASLIRRVVVIISHQILVTDLQGNVRQPERRINIKILGVEGLSSQLQTKSIERVSGLSCSVSRVSDYNSRDEIEYRLFKKCFMIRRRLNQKEKVSLVLIGYCQSFFYHVLVYPVTVYRVFVCCPCETANPTITQTFPIKMMECSC